MKATLRLAVTVTGAETSQGAGGSEKLELWLDLDGGAYGQNPMIGMLRGALEEGRKLSTAALENMSQRP